MPRLWIVVCVLALVGFAGFNELRELNYDVIRLSNLADTTARSDEFIRPLLEQASKWWLDEINPPLFGKIIESSAKLDSAPLGLKAFRNYYWIRGLSTSNVATTGDFRKALVEAQFASIRDDRYSFKRLRAHVEQRNSLKMLCEKYPDNSWLTSGGLPACDVIDKSLLVNEWQLRYENSPAAKSHAVFNVDGKTVLIPRRHATIRVCNAAPYSVFHMVYAVTRPSHLNSDLVISNDDYGHGWGVLNGWNKTETGDCVKRQIEFIGKDPEFYVHSKFTDNHRATWVNQSINHLILSDNNDANDAFAIENMQLEVRGIYVRGEPIQQCIDDNEPMQNVWTAANFRLACAQQNRRPELFMPAAKLSGSEKTWIFVVQAPNLSVLKLEENDQITNENLEKALSAIRLISDSIDVQMPFGKKWSGSALPFLIGGTLHDENGPFNLGVRVLDVVANSIFAEAPALRSGDVVLSINGNPTFGERDFNKYLFDHGTSRTHGIDVPIKMQVFRNGNYFEINSRYFFNPDYRATGSDSKGLAIWYGLGDMLTWGQTKWASCAANNLARRAVNTLGWVAEFGCKVVERYNDAKYDCPENASSTFEYVDTTECAWQNAQERAYTMQRQQELYLNSQWLGIFTPGAIRAVFAKSAKKKAFKTLGKSSLALGAATGVLEAIESGLWSFGTAPPGSPLLERLPEAGVIAGLGFGAGFLSTIILEKAR